MGRYDQHRDKNISFAFMAISTLCDTPYTIVVMRNSHLVESSWSLIDHFYSGKPCAASMDLSQRADSTKGWIDELPNAMNQGL